MNEILPYENFPQLEKIYIKHLTLFRGMKRIIINYCSSSCGIMKQANFQPWLQDNRSQQHKFINFGYVTGQRLEIQSGSVQETDIVFQSLQIKKIKALQDLSILENKNLLVKERMDKDMQTRRDAMVLIDRDTESTSLEDKIKFYHKYVRKIKKITKANQTKEIVDQYVSFDQNEKLQRPKQKKERKRTVITQQMKNRVIQEWNIYFNRRKVFEVLKDTYSFSPSTIANIVKDHLQKKIKKTD